MLLLRTGLVLVLTAWPVLARADDDIGHAAWRQPPPLAVGKIAVLPAKTGQPIKTDVDDVASRPPAGSAMQLSPAALLSFALLASSGRLLPQTTVTTNGR